MSVCGCALVASDVSSCRCASLQDLAVTWQPRQDVANEPERCHARFQGQGSTNAER
jgi:hypothetical protein